MRSVEDEAGRRYLLLRRSAASSLVLDPATGERRHVANDRLGEPSGEDPLRVAAGAIPDPGGGPLATLGDGRALGLLAVLEAGPRPVRELLGATELCESDLLGLASELRAAGLLEAATVDGEAGYAASGAAREALQSARAGASTSSD